MIFKYNRELTRIEENGRTITLFSLFISQFLNLLFGSLIGTANTFLLSNYSEVAVASINISNSVVSLVNLVCSVISGGAAILLSVALGEKNREKAGKITGNALMLLVGIALVVSIVLYALRYQVIGCMNVTGEAYDLSVKYFEIKMIFFELTAISSALSTSLICSGYAFVTILNGLLTNILNVMFVSYVLYIKSITFLPTISMVSLCGCVAQFVSLILLIILFKHFKCPLILQGNRHLIWNILKIGIPGGISSGAYGVSQTITTAIIASIGIVAVQTKVYCSNILNYVFLLSYSLGYGTSILLGRYKGMGQTDSIKKLYKQSTVIAFAINTVISLTFFLIGKYLIGMLTKNQEILRLAAIIVFIDIFVEIPRAINNVTDNALRAVGDVISPLVIALTGDFVFNVLFSYILGVVFKFGVVGCWIALAMDETVKAILYFIIWRKEKWKKITLI